MTGLPNPLTKASTETPLDGVGHPLATDPAALDTEALVRLPDGTFWIGEENAPSVLHVAADGTVLRRFVPARLGGRLRRGRLPVEGTLPAILTKRQLNRGIESLALDADGFLWAVLQNPLANPDADAFKAAANARMLKIDPASGRPVAEYVYTLEPMANFPGENKKAQSTARISELAYIGGTQLPDRRSDRQDDAHPGDRRGRRQRHPGQPLGRSRDRAEPRTVDLAAAGIVPVTKRLVLDSSALPQLPTKIEGMTLVDGVLYLLNDDDFGIEGERTQLVVAKGLPIGE